MVDAEIRELLGKLCSQTRRNYSGLLQEFNLHVGQEHALCQLWMEEGITQFELSKRMGCEPPTLTNMLKKLEEYGLIYRKRDPVDGRVSRVYLTSEGRALKQPIQEVWGKQQEKLLDGILPEERMLLRRLLQQMLENIS
ncbi:MarR family transcriptional regulator [Bacillus sp. J14TS2]|uniref:MarR family winged helix-turn-helix transcriptional regulator n=1 Tax=Bacillus sp. J14TS2 TaxID=2807188 RepID=UPI001B046F60|nr:MarR family transcriptional regulator [Bacillus sp. J14TS2]GIN74922.1 MarR family transcriptional regulator [Bacillus sp. J14TS2]